MAPQPPAGQADFSTILPILALAMNRKGGANSGDISNVFNELMGIMSNSYSAPSTMSDEEIMSVYAPQTISLQNTDDPILQGILADIQSGTPALKIKEAIRQGITTVQSSQLVDQTTFHCMTVWLMNCLLKRSRLTRSVMRFRTSKPSTNSMACQTHLNSLMLHNCSQRYLLQCLTVLPQRKKMLISA